ncbi:MAG: T9SS type A sorting domain-containing protein, partial [Flavobacteriales bacterium]
QLASNATIVLFDAAGKLTYSSAMLTSGVHKLSLMDFHAGVYTMHVQTADHSQVLRLVIE